VVLIYPGFARVKETSPVAVPVISLLSRDPALTQSVGTIVEEMENLRLLRGDTLAGACSRLQRQEPISLFLYHLVGNEDVTKAAQLLQAVVAAKRPVATIVLCEHYRAEQVLALLRLGAADCLAQPFDLTRLGFLIDVLTVRARLAAPQSVARSEGAAKTPSWSHLQWSGEGGFPPSQPHFPQRFLRGADSIQALGESHPFLYNGGAGMDRLMEQVLRVAPQETTVLLTGATGTGKTRLASLIHELSPRRSEPFLSVQCGALSATLIESELFGHVRGAFTGADHERAGKFADAGRGTVLMDDIDALAPPQQAKLLRAVEDRVFEPVGSNKTMPIRARLIAATNRRLEDAVRAGRFREDLYFRLNVVEFHLPPLRERSGVVPSLVGRFVTEFATRNGRPVHGIAAAALPALQAYDWPGNVRELRNVIERAVALSPNAELQLSDFPEAIRSLADPASSAVQSAPVAQAPQGTLAQTKEHAEAARISAALARNGNNRLRAAAELGISRMTLYKKLYRYGFMAPSCETAKRTEPPDPSDGKDCS
jgi:DNA-binding NtrC family response regulator